MPRLDTIPKYKTSVDWSHSWGMDVWTVRLHGHDIMEIRIDPQTPPAQEHTNRCLGDHATDVTFNSHGWRTRTTKRRMNQVLSAFGVNATVIQRNRVWYVVDHNTEDNERIPFYDGVVLRCITNGDHFKQEETGYLTGSRNTSRGEYSSNPKQLAYATGR